MQRNSLALGNPPASCPASAAPAWWAHKKRRSMGKDSGELECGQTVGCLLNSGAACSRGGRCVTRLSARASSSIKTHQRAALAKQSSADKERCAGAARMQS